MKKSFLTYEKPLLTVMVQADNPARVEELIDKSLPEGGRGIRYAVLPNAARIPKQRDV